MLISSHRLTLTTLNRLRPSSEGDSSPLARSGPEDSQDRHLARLPGGAHCSMSSISLRRRTNVHAGSEVGHLELMPGLGIEVDHRNAAQAPAAPMKGPRSVLPPVL